MNSATEDAAPRNPSVSADSDVLTIKVKAPDGTEVTFRVKPTTQLGKVMDAFVQRVQRTRDAVKFLFEGDRVQATDTPKSLGVEEGDQIDAFWQQNGGGESHAPDAGGPVRGATC